jgi:hypothetical protein
MLYNVEEASIKLNVSKQTIYTRLKIQKYKDKVVTKQGRSMIDDELLRLIKLDLEVTNKCIPVDSASIKETAIDKENPVITMDENDLIKLNKELVKSLIEQLTDTKLLLKNSNLLLKDANSLIKEKDAIITNQLNESNIRLKDQQELTRNGQVLQSQNIKYIELTEKMREEPIVKKGFMSKLFKK